MVQRAVAGQHRRLALAAGAAAAHRRRVDARGLDGLQHALMRADPDAEAGAREAHRVGLADRGRDETLDMQGLLGPAEAARRRQHPFDHGGGAADREMRAQRLVTEQPVEVDPLATIVVVDADAGPVRGDEVVRIGRMLARPDRIMELEGLLVALELVQHGEERRDADAARHEQVLAGALLDREKIDGVADDEPRADA